MGGFWVLSPRGVQYSCGNILVSDPKLRATWNQAWLDLRAMMAKHNIAWNPAWDRLKEAERLREVFWALRAYLPGVQIDVRRNDPTAEGIKVRFPRMVRLRTDLGTGKMVA
jgi:hypothetical protein